MIDGGSTDGSVNIIKEYADYINYWISEPDKGIYNAMNKGVAQAHGEYCQFLNSGDWLYDNQVVDKFCKLNCNEDIVLGKTAHIYNDNSILIDRSVTGNITFLDLYLGGINHQSSFIKTELCKNNPYDETLKICSDWKFYILTLIYNNCSFKTIDDIIVYFDMQGFSNVNSELNGNERIKILESFNIPPRIIENYHNLDKETYEIAKLLHPYVGFRKKMFKLVKIITTAYSKIRK